MRSYHTVILILILILLATKHSRYERGSGCRSSRSRRCVILVVVRARVVVLRVRVRVRARRCYQLQPLAISPRQATARARRCPAAGKHSWRRKTIALVRDALTRWRRAISLYYGGLHHIGPSYQRTRRVAQRVRYTRAVRLSPCILRAVQPPVHLSHLVQATVMLLTSGSHPATVYASANVQAASLRAQKHQVVSTHEGADGAQSVQ